MKFPAEDWRNAQKSQILFKVQFDFLYPSISHYIFLNFNWFQFQENKLSNLWERKKRLLKSSGSIEKCLGMSEALLPTISGKFRKKFQPLIHEVKKRNFQCHQVFSDTYLCITMGLKFILRGHFYFHAHTKIVWKFKVHLVKIQVHIKSFLRELTPGNTGLSLHNLV